jgi:Zn-dependent protease
MGDIFSGIGNWLINLIYWLPGILVGFVLHEFSHALMADRLGDPTPRMMGRLTLNPIAHIDPLGFLMLVVAHFGWAKPVMTNPAKYKIKRYGFALVGIAGPLMNLLLMVIFFFTVSLLGKYGVLTDTNPITLILVYAIYINAALFIFNLIPIPPLDGYNILKDLVLVKFVNPRSLWNLERYGQFMLLGLILFMSYSHVNVIGSVTSFLVQGMDSIFIQLFH